MEGRSQAEMAARALMRQVVLVAGAVAALAGRRLELVDAAATQLMSCRPQQLPVGVGAAGLAEFYQLIQGKSQPLLASLYRRLVLV